MSYYLFDLDDDINIDKLVIGKTIKFDDNNFNDENQL